MNSSTEAARDRTHRQRERAWLEAEVAAAASLTDAERVRILRELVRVAQAIREQKSADELARDEETRRALDDPGKERYRVAAERLA